MNDMSFPGGSKWVVQPEQHGISSEPPTEKARYNLSEAEGRNAGQEKNQTNPQITFIPISHKTLQVFVKGEVRER